MKVRRPAWIPWWRITTLVSLTFAFGIAAAAGRVIEAIVIGILLLPSLAFVAVWVYAWRRDRLADD
jgi:hypothetical protein